MGVAGVSAPATRIRPYPPSYHPPVKLSPSCSFRRPLRHRFSSSLWEETHCFRNAEEGCFGITSCSIMKSIRVSGKICLRGAMTYGRLKFSIPHRQLASTSHLKADSFHSMVQSNTCIMNAHTPVNDCGATIKIYGTFEKMRAEWSRETKRLQSIRQVTQICGKYQERIPRKADTSLERDISLLSSVAQNLHVQDYSCNIVERSKDLWELSQDLHYEVPERLNDVNQISRKCMINGNNSLRLETLPELVTDFTKLKPKVDGVEDDDKLEFPSQLATKKSSEAQMMDHKKTLAQIYDKVLIVDTILAAKKVVQMLTTKYRNFVHACDTEVANIDVRQETPVDHGDMICLSIYSGPGADFGSGKSCVWVDMLDGENNILNEFKPFFEDPSIKKVWHNYSFDRHIIANYGIRVSGFHADTMHLARLWDSSRRTNGGYSLEALTSDFNVMNGKGSSGSDIDLTTGKISMKDIFGKKKMKKDGTEGKLVTIASVDILQREERIPWICYSALDSMSTLKLFESLKSKLLGIEWRLGSVIKGNMYDFYERYWRPFGNLLVEMEAEGMLVDRAHLSEIEKVAIKEQKVAADIFRKWASRYCADAKYMNVGSDTQIRQLFFGGVVNIKNQNESLPYSRSFKVPTIDNVIEEGKKTASKFRNIELHSVVDGMQAELYTASGWPSVSGDALRTFVGKISAKDIYVTDEDFQSDNSEDITYCDTCSQEDTSTSAYGTAYTAFGGGIKGREACHAIAALCEICSIDSLISNFILPLQGNHISGRSGRIHCSLNINTETGRLSARRPNLQNPPALEKDRYKIREAFVAAPGNSLIVADYGQLELRILAHLSDCKSMLAAFEAGGDFHSRTAMNMYDYIREAVHNKEVLLEWHSHPGEEKPPVPLLKDTFAAERRKAKMLNFSIAYGKTPVGLSRDWKVSVKEAKETVSLWYRDRAEVLKWQQARKNEALKNQCVHTLLGRARHFPSVSMASSAQRGHIERAAINTPVQGSAADVAMCAMLQIAKNDRLRELKWKLLLQVHDEVILEGPSESAEEAKDIVVECMSKPFDGHNFLKVDLSVDAKCAQTWYAAK